VKLQALDWDRYRSCRNQIKGKLREAERKFVYKRINDKNNNNSLWKTVRECIPRKEKTRSTYSRKVVEVANEFNEYFSSVGAKAAEEPRALVTSYGLTSTHPEMLYEFSEEIDKFHFHPVSFDVDS
jgi:MoxR-like ATPase